MVDLVLYEIGFWISRILSGLAFIVILIVIVRKIFRFEKYITIDHIELINKIILVIIIMTWLRLLVDIFISWYHGYIYEQFAFYNRALGKYWWSYFLVLLMNIVIPLFLFLKKVRRSFFWTFVIALMMNGGMYFERLVILITSMNRDYLPSMWNMY